MAPRTRSNRIEHLSREDLLASGQTVNTTGFPALPHELYLKIISNFPSAPFNLEMLALIQKFPKAARNSILAFPDMPFFAFRVFEVYPKQELVKQLEVLTIRDPSLAQYVNILNVVIVDYSTENVLAELARWECFMPPFNATGIHKPVTCALQKKQFNSWLIVMHKRLKS
ncbi:hypothetical protein CPB84DRAFT_1843859 [Gymnopilus junonius]|uniref:Uncharacterized protein n=1 Tax=Gymnopilus junonius TaxID=109634 RepID=A0A9P5NUX8_GYMJU|nr:hypothetical protein CPB84DRAFT_1843859 [Gymnopilus junonius]